MTTPGSAFPATGGFGGVGSQVHLLAALAGVRGVVAAQAVVGAKTNEIPMITPLLDELSLDRLTERWPGLPASRAFRDALAA